MCIAVYKPYGANMPNDNVLKTCFNNNPDGAGFMVASGGVVHIRKGYMTFNAFKKALKKAMKEYGEQAPYVLHFRITTQAGVRKDCTHPFPLSDKMDDLRKLSTTSEIGIAHNGVISLTSESVWSSKNKTIDYSDTMRFITDYASLIIDSKKWYKNDNSITLLERLINGSRLAILGGDGHCELVGSWVLDSGVWYSNSSYKDFETRWTYASLLDDDNDAAVVEDDALYCDGRFNAKRCKKCEFYDYCIGNESEVDE